MRCQMFAAVYLRAALSAEFTINTSTNTRSSAAASGEGLLATRCCSADRTASVHISPQRCRLRVHSLTDSAAPLSTVENGRRASSGRCRHNSEEGDINQAFSRPGGGELQTAEKVSGLSQSRSFSPEHLRRGGCERFK